MGQRRVDKSLRDFRLPRGLLQQEAQEKAPMLAPLTLYVLWLFMTGFMLAVVVAGGRTRQTRRMAEMTKAPQQAIPAPVVSLTSEARSLRP